MAEEDIGKRKWQMTLVQLSHTPMTKEAGRAYSRNVGDINQHFDGLLRAMKRSTEEWKQEMKKPIKSSVKVILEPGEKDEFNIGA